MYTCTSQIVIIIIVNCVVACTIVCGEIFAVRIFHVLNFVAFNFRGSNYHTKTKLVTHENFFAYGIIYCVFICLQFFLLQVMDKKLQSKSGLRWLLMCVLLFSLFYNLPTISPSLPLYTVPPYIPSHLLSPSLHSCSFLTTFLLLPFIVPILCCRFVDSSGTTSNPLHISRLRMILPPGLWLALSETWQQYHLSTSG